MAQNGKKYLENLTALSYKVSFDLKKFDELTVLTNLIKPDHERIKQVVLI